MHDDRPPRWAREQLTQITTVERDGTYHASEPGVSFTGESDDWFQSIINYFKQCRDSKLSPADSRVEGGSDR